MSDGINIIINGYFPLSDEFDSRQDIDGVDGECRVWTQDISIPSSIGTDEEGMLSIRSNYSKGFLISRSEENSYVEAIYETRINFL